LLFRYQRAKRTLSAATVATIEIDSLLEGIGKKNEHSTRFTSAGSVRVINELRSLLHESH